MSLVASRETKQVSDRFERRFGRVEETVSLYRGPSDPKQKYLSSLPVSLMSTFMIPFFVRKRLEI